METYEDMDNKSQENKISVDELLRRKRERNAKNREVVSNNYQKRNEAIAKRYGQNTEELLLGEAQIDLQMRLLDAEDRAITRFNDNYTAMTNKVIADNDAKADLEAERISNTIDVEYQTLEEVKDADIALPARRTRFTNTLMGTSEEQNLSLPSSSSKSSSVFDDLKEPE